jgi:hypothetical protein
LEEDPTVQKYVRLCQEQGREIIPQDWWHTCKLTNLCLWRVMAEMPAKREFYSKEEHGVYRHIKKAQEAAAKMKKGQGLESVVIYNATTLEDIWKTIVTWQRNPNGVPPAVHEDPNTHKLNVCDIDITLWVKAIAPSDKKEFRRFQNLIFKVFLLANSTSSLLGIDLNGSIGLQKPRASSLWESIVVHFACPAGKTIEQVTAHDVSGYIQKHVSLTWDWIWEWICPYIE